MRTSFRVPDVASKPRGTLIFSSPDWYFFNPMDFSSLGLSPKVIEAVAKAGYTTPTAIQLGAIPHALARKDVLGLAQTGSGKTAAFVLPMLHLLEKGRARARMPRTLILEPTRELAMQVEEAFDRLGQLHKLTVATLIGGVAFDPQAAKIDRGADVVIATPGRLLDHFERGKLLLNGIELLVVDEADRMLDMGFIPDIERIYKLVPFTRQTLFFSATMPPEIQRITSQFLHNPVRVETSAVSSTAASIEQNMVKAPSDPKMKRDALRQLLRSQTNVKNGIIFANRKTTVAVIEKSMQKHGFSVGALHGDMDQSSRMACLAAFRANEITFLVASDVAARGLDIPDVSHVFNFDIPIHAEDYVHRIGRTGRAGREGHAFTMVTREDTKYLKAIEQLIKKEIPWFGGAAAAEVPQTEARAEKPLREKRATNASRKPTRRETAPVVEVAVAEVPVEVEAAPPKREQQARKDQSRGSERNRPEPHNIASVPDNSRFDDSNMPAFLNRPVRSA
jgi:superfamily II DNA/RNA helicase